MPHEGISDGAIGPRQRDSKNGQLVEGLELIGPTDIVDRMGVVSETCMDIVAIQVVVRHQRVRKGVRTASPMLHGNPETAGFHHLASRGHKDHGRRVQTVVVYLESLEQIAIVRKRAASGAQLIPGNFEMRVVAQASDVSELYVITHGMHAPLSLAYRKRNGRGPMPAPEADLNPKTPGMRRI